jgi:heme/copper-type cytochrome/quinol oxidase subunit 3
MNDGAEMTVETPVLPTDLRRARALAALSVALGAFSCIAAWRVAVLRTFPNTFPWLTLALALAGTVTAIMALRQLRRGRLATVLAWLGLVASLAFPILVVFVFVRYLNVN